MCGGNIKSAVFKAASRTALRGDGKGGCAGQERGYMYIYNVYISSGSLRNRLLQHLFCHVCWPVG